MHRLPSADGKTCSGGVRADKDAGGHIYTTLFWLFAGFCNSISIIITYGVRDPQEDATPKYNNLLLPCSALEILARAAVMYL